MSKRILDTGEPISDRDDATSSENESKTGHEKGTVASGAPTEIQEVSGAHPVVSDSLDKLCRSSFAISSHKNINQSIEFIKLLDLAQGKPIPDSKPTYYLEALANIYYEYYNNIVHALNGYDKKNDLGRDLGNLVDEYWPYLLACVYLSKAHELFPCDKYDLELKAFFSKYVKDYNPDALSLKNINKVLSMSAKNEDVHKYISIIKMEQFVVRNLKKAVELFPENIMYKSALCEAKLEFGMMILRDIKIFEFRRPILVAKCSLLSAYEMTLEETSLSSVIKDKCREVYAESLFMWANVKNLNQRVEYVKNNPTSLRTFEDYYTDYNINNIKEGSFIEQTKIGISCTFLERFNRLREALELVPTNDKFLTHYRDLEPVLRPWLKALIYSYIKDKTPDEAMNIAEKVYSTKHQDALAGSSSGSTRSLINKFAELSLHDKEAASSERDGNLSDNSEVSAKVQVDKGRISNLQNTLVSALAFETTYVDKDGSEKLSGAFTLKMPLRLIDLIALYAFENVEVIGESTDS